MSTWKSLAGAAVLGLGVWACSAGLATAAEKTAEPAGLRVGVYDSRALAVAYVRTPEFSQNVSKLIKERDEAKAAGDMDKVKAIEAQGKAGQARRHEQGFSGAPVDDILETIKDKLPQVAEASGVDMIVSKWQIAYQTPGAKFVDVTDAIVKLFNPDDKALRIIEDLKGKPLIPVEEVRRHKH
jgi:hypothetical protein